MFPYLDFAVVSFVLFAGFLLGALFGYFLKEMRARSYFDGDGEPIPMQDVTEARLDLARVIPFPAGRHRRAS